MKPYDLFFSEFLFLSVVISIRKVGQIVGGETCYDGIFQPWIYAWKNEGVEGLFAGLAPALFGEIVKVVCLSVLRRGIEYLLPLEEDEGLDEYEDEDINAVCFCILPFGCFEEFSLSNTWFHSLILLHCRIKSLSTKQFS